MERYPNISDHGLIGDGQTTALVTSDGVIDFFCCPRFDSPTVFGSLLDADGGGNFRVSPAGGNYVSKQLYFPDTAMLITRFMTADRAASRPASTASSVTCGWPAARCRSRWTSSPGSTMAAPSTRSR